MRNVTIERKRDKKKWSICSFMTQHVKDEINSCHMFLFKWEQTLTLFFLFYCTCCEVMRLCDGAVMGTKGGSGGGSCCGGSNCGDGGGSFIISAYFSV